MRTTLTTTGGSLLAALLLAALVLAGCSSDGDDPTAASTSTSEGSRTSAGDGTTTTAGGGPAGTGGTGTTLPAAAAAPLNDLAGQLNDADLGCESVEGQRAADGAQGAAQCDLTDAPAYLYTFTDDQQRDDFIDGGGVIDCTFIFGSGVSFDYVVADGVIVRPEDNADAQALADALGGEVRTITCELPDDAGSGG